MKFRKVWIVETVEYGFKVPLAILENAEDPDQEAEKWFLEHPSLRKTGTVLERTIEVME